MKYEKQIREIISKAFVSTESIDKVDCKTNLQDIGMDSLTFVEIIIEIENLFEIEFPDDMLVMSESGTIKELCGIVASAIQKNEEE